MEPKKWRYPAQPERYEKSPGMRDYENMLGHYDLNFSDFDAYLAHTQCAVGSGKGGNPPPRIDDMGPDWKPEDRGQKSESVNLLPLPIVRNEGGFAVGGRSQWLRPASWG